MLWCGGGGEASYPAAMVANQLSFNDLKLYHGLSIS